MSKFWMVTEDPDYDEDGILADEDWADAAVNEYEAQQLAQELESFDPFDTVNS